MNRNQLLLESKSILTSALESPASVATRTSVEEVLDEYPDLKRDDILPCIAYGAEMSRKSYVEIPVEASR